MIDRLNLQSNMIIIYNKNTFQLMIVITKSGLWKDMRFFDHRKKAKIL